MTFANPSTPGPASGAAGGGVTVLDRTLLDGEVAQTAEAGLFEYQGIPPLRRERLLFANDTGNLSVRLWDSTPFVSALRTCAVHELVQLLEGEVTITEDDGTTSRFRAGDVFFIPSGTLCSWRAAGPIKTYVCILDPSVG